MLRDPDVAAELDVRPLRVKDEDAEVVRGRVEVGDGEPEGAPGLGDGRPPAARDEPLEVEAAVLPGRREGDQDGGGEGCPEPGGAAHE